MKRTIDLDQVRVVQTNDVSGNPVVYLEIMDTRVLYTTPDNLPNHYVSQDEFGGRIVDTDLLADLFRHRLGSVLGQTLLAKYPDLTRDMSWSTETSQELWGTSVRRLDEDQYT